MTLKFFSASKHLSLALAFSSFCLVTTSAIAEDAIIAVVNGDNITKSQLEIAAIQSKVEIDKITDEQKKALTDALVNRQLVLQEALKEKFDQDPGVKSRVQALVDSYIAANYLAKLAESFKIPETEMQAYYDKNVIGKMPKEYKARHILVKTEDEAKALIKEIEGGADFSKLATEKSIDTGSAVKGGDLGWFTGQNMVASFAQAIAGMKKGELNKTPIQSQFGWHVITLDDERETPAPKFDEVKPEIEKVIIKAHLNQYLTKLNNNAKVSINP